MTLSRKLQREVSEQMQGTLPQATLLACADGRGPATEATGPSATLRFSHIALMTELKQQSHLSDSTLHVCNKLQSLATIL